MSEKAHGHAHLDQRVPARIGIAVAQTIGMRVDDVSAAMAIARQGEIGQRVRAIERQLRGRYRALESFQ